MQLLLNRLSQNSLVLAYLETNAVFSIVITIITGAILIIGSSSFLTMATSKSSWPVPLVNSRTLSINSYVGFTLQATPYDFNNYLAVFQNMLTFNAPPSSVNTTSASKTATIVNQTTSEKTPLLTSAAGLLNLNRFHNQSLYTSHPYFIPPSSSSDSLQDPRFRTLPTFRTYLAHPYSTSSSNMSSVVNSNNKAIMLGFDDGWKSQISYAKPILDKYGFKASFFIVCNYVNSGEIRRMNWQDIASLQKDGMDIESHSMTHTPYLNILHQNGLDYEIGGSKQCLSMHGYNSTIFAYPYNSGSNDPAVVNTVAKYYNMGRSGTAPLMFLNCIGFNKHPQSDCRTYGPNGELNYANRYVVRSLSFDIVEIKDSFNSTKMFSDFVKIVNSQSTFNHGGKLNAIPLITFHNITFTTNRPYNTNVGLFDQLMKYLYENHVKVLTYKQLGYNTHANTFYLNG
ncbi:MAG TPA: polysaccharide deacetylase family protein [Candidatus Bathyarchaeia archaeon]|nr:polysaccharide deacetylase family protein [Candidatus Bathyarchaeia archaeon]